MMKPKTWTPIVVVVAASILLLTRVSPTDATLQSFRVYLPLVQRDPFAIVTTCPPLHVRPDPAIIADGILHRGSDEPLFDPEERSALIRQIEHVLSLIRESRPQMAHIHAREAYWPGRLVVDLEPALRETVASVIGGQTGPIVFETGYQAFDDLNRRLHLRALELPPLSALLCFDAGLNSPVASEVYSALEAIRYAEPNDVFGDGPDVDALRDGDTWYVVFRDAWGDCTAGCIHEDLFFFTVAGDEVVEVDPSQAMSDPHFSQLIDLVRPGEPSEPEM